MDTLNAAKVIGFYQVKQQIKYIGVPNIVKCDYNWCVEVLINNRNEQWNITGIDYKNLIAYMTGLKELNTIQNYANIVKIKP